jgi:hypothetical protein
MHHMALVASCRFISYVSEIELHCLHDTVASCRSILVWMVMRSTLKWRCLCSLHAISALHAVREPKFEGEAAVLKTILFATGEGKE